MSSSPAKALMPPRSGSREQAANWFRALGDETRLQIMTNPFFCLYSSTFFDLIEGGHRERPRSQTDDQREVQTTRISARPELKMSSFSRVRSNRFRCRTTRSM